MANLAEAVDATETDWIISADLDDDIDFLTVEDEIVHVTANFPAQYQLGEGTTSVPRIRVERGAGGTTAASHADTTALTPLIPPSSSGGGGDVPDPTGAPDGQVPTTASGVYSLETLPKDFYAQDTDPGAVGAGSVWKDTSAIPYLSWERDAANTGWDAYSRFEVTAAGAGHADASTGASSDDGDASLQRLARATGNGVAAVGGTAIATTGNANAQSIATTTSGQAFADQTATTATGEAYVGGYAEATGAGDAHVLLAAVRSGIGTGSFAIDATAAGLVFTLSGLPTADPVIADALWNDAGTLKVSAG